jgi:DNA-binding MurR/RpiR family transcriptional regulator
MPEGEMTYRERIRNNYERLSKSQKRIADFLMTSHREAAFMTASRLAAVLDVDVATITRFAQRLDYPGYPEMLEEVRMSVQEEMSAGYHPVEGASVASRSFVHALSVERDNLERTLASISMEAVEKAVDAMSRARQIYIVGQHTAVLSAKRLAIVLQMLDLKPVVVEGDGVTMALGTRSLSSEDVIVGIAYSAYATDVVAVLRLARQRGATIISISGSEVSPVTRIADIKLICAANSAMHIPSDTVAGAVIDGLGQALWGSRTEIWERNMRALGGTFETMLGYRGNAVSSIEESLMKLY